MRIVKQNVCRKQHETSQALESRLDAGHIGDENILTYFRSRNNFLIRPTLAALFNVRTLKFCSIFLVFS